MFKSKEIREFVDKNIPIKAVMERFYDIDGEKSFPSPFPEFTDAVASFSEEFNGVVLSGFPFRYMPVDVLNFLPPDQVVDFLMYQMQVILEESGNKDLTGLGKMILDLIVHEMEFGDLGVAYAWPEGLAEKLDAALMGFDFPEGDYPTRDLMDWLGIGGFRELSDQFNLLRDVMLIGKVDVNDLTYKTLLAVVAGDGQLEEVKQNARTILDTMERRV